MTAIGAMRDLVAVLRAIRDQPPPDEGALVGAHPKPRPSAPGTATVPGRMTFTVLERGRE